MRRGLTVLEVLVGLTLLGLVAVPIFSLARVQECEGEQLAERLLVSQRLTELADGLECTCLMNHFSTLQDTPPRPHAVGSSGFAIEEEARVTAAGSPGLYCIRVKARWRTAVGRGTREMEYVRLVADPEWGTRPHMEPAASEPIETVATMGEDE